MPIRVTGRVSRHRKRTEPLSVDAPPNLLSGASSRARERRATGSGRDGRTDGVASWSVVRVSGGGGWEAGGGSGKRQLCQCTFGRRGVCLVGVASRHVASRRAGHRRSVPVSFRRSRAESGGRGARGIRRAFSTVSLPPRGSRSLSAGSGLRARAGQLQPNQKERERADGTGRTR